ncbi:MAG: hypothetical protein OSJ62_07665 [Lachnospiraceae bacterium]|nr:hypothetical protein [Lachnospiraceae bacterium]
MADFVIKNPTEFDPNLRKLETTDRNHADVFNKEFEQLINNDAFLKAVTELAIEHMRSDAVHVTEQDKQNWSGKAGTAVATQSADGLESAADKRKLDEIAAGAEVNQNAFSNIKVGNVTLSANGKTATFTLEAGANITITADNASKKIVITADKNGGNADTVDGYHAAHFAAADHGHDGRYYTKTESDNLLNQKANSSHSHNGVYYTKDEINAALNGKANASHDHNGTYLPNLSGLASGYVTTGQKAGSILGGHATAEGVGTEANAYTSHAEGNNTTASGTHSHAEGGATTASGSDSHAEGMANTASGTASHVEGIFNDANGDYSHAEGRSNETNGDNSHAEGFGNRANGVDSHVEGINTIASGNYSHAEGNNTIASNDSSHAGGKYNADMTISTTSGHAFVIGKGTSSSARSNAFSVMFNGTVKAAGTITASTAADYAEFFEWLDGNPDKEDRVGHFVTLDGTKIRYANSQDDYILGIISGQPFVLGNGDCDTWNGMYLRDEFNRVIQEPAPKIEMVDVTEEIERKISELDDKTGKVIIKSVKEMVVVGSVEKEVFEEDGTPVYEGTRAKLNPNYDSDQKYISRFDRPEWDAVGMLGVLSVYDDGTCEINGYCKCNDFGIATKAESGYRVIERITENIVKVVFR